MYKYLKTTLVFLGVWFCASLLNGLLSGGFIAFLVSTSFADAMRDLFLSVFFSFVFSALPVGFVWLVTTIAQVTGMRSDNLFQLILGTTFFCALFAAIVFIKTIGMEFKEVRYIAGLSIIISALSAVLIFRRRLKDPE